MTGGVDHFERAFKAEGLATWLDDWHSEAFELATAKAEFDR
jgi:hypothetical protein